MPCHNSYPCSISAYLSPFLGTLFCQITVNRWFIAAAHRYVRWTKGYFWILFKKTTEVTHASCNKFKEYKTENKNCSPNQAIKNKPFPFQSHACMLSHFSHVWLCDPTDCSPPGSSVHGVLQAGILEWVAMLFSRGSSWSRDWTWASYVSCIGRQVLYQ